VGCRLGELGLQSVQYMSHLGLDGVGIGLFEDRPQQCGHPWLGGLRNLAQHIPGVMRAASLPRGAGQDRAVRVHQADVSIGDDQLDARQAAGDQRA